MRNNGPDERIDIYAPIQAHILAARKEDAGFQYSDGVHPDNLGHWLIAREILKKLFNITLERTPDFVSDPNACPDYLLEQERHDLLGRAWRKHIGHNSIYHEDAPPLSEACRQAENLTGEIEQAIGQAGIRDRVEETSQKSCTRLDFYVNGREAIVIMPQKRKAGNPWLWRTEFFEAFDNAEEALLGNGYCRAYLRLPDLYGNAEAVELMDGLYLEMVSRFGMSEKPVIIGLSRGGLYAVNFTSQNPQKVGALYLDAPLVDITHWPTLRDADIEGIQELDNCTRDHSFIAALEGNKALSAEARMERLAVSGIPVLIVSGDSDRVVPYEQNGLVLEQMCRAANAEIKVIIKSGGDHHPHGLTDPGPIMNFIETHC